MFFLDAWASASYPGRNERRKDGRQAGRKEGRKAGRKEGSKEQGRKDCSSCFISFHQLHKSQHFFIIFMFIFMTFYDFLSMVQCFHDFAGLFLHVHDFSLRFHGVSSCGMICHFFMVSLICYHISCYHCDNFPLFSRFVFLLGFSCVFIIFRHVPSFLRIWNYFS